MTNIIKTNSRRRQKTYVRHLGGGLRLRAEISLCVFMYPGYPLQITISMCRRAGESLGTAHATDRTKNASTYTDTTVQRLLASIRVQPCKRCGTPAFDPGSVDTNRGGLCEKCFLADLNADWAKSEQATQQQLAARDSRMKKNGYAFRVTAWVYSGQGDDYQVNWYVRYRPTVAEVREHLRAEGSAALDDFQVVQL